ncbi:MAG: hypothetical protein KAQ72_13280 [Desulfobacula sp.]|nr:hypothetical protein [Desulfobacula sp.]
MKKLITILVTLVMAFAFIMGAGAEDKKIEVEGTSLLSREDALRQALRLAVEQSVGVFIQLSVEIENYELKKDKIMSRAQGYIKQYSVLKDETSGSLYLVGIRATVSLDKIKDDLLAMKILLSSMDLPKLMILIQENYVDMDNIGMQIAETELYSQLSAKGFDLVDKAQLETIKNQSRARQALAGNIDAAKSLGMALGAQYIILGKAVTQDAGEAYSGTGLKSIQATLQLRVIQTQSGIILGSVVKSGVAAHISPLTGATNALRASVQAAVKDYLVNAIAKSFQDFVNNGAPLKLNISGVKTFQEYKQIVTGMEEIDKVVSSKKEGWNKAGGLLVLDLRFKGTSEELAEYLDGMNLNKKSLEVIDFAPDRVDCNFR